MNTHQIHIQIYREEAYLARLEANIAARNEDYTEEHILLAEAKMKEFMARMIEYTLRRYAAR